MCECPGTFFFLRSRGAMPSGDSEGRGEDCLSWVTESHRGVPALSQSPFDMVKRALSQSESGRFVVSFVMYWESIGYRCPGKGVSVVFLPRFFGVFGKGMEVLLCLLFYSFSSFAFLTFSADWVRSQEHTS